MRWGEGGNEDDVVPPGAREEEGGGQQREWGLGVEVDLQWEANR